jgi:hypothetical protein
MTNDGEDKGESEDGEDSKLTKLDLQSIVVAWHQRDPNTIPEQQIQLVKESLVRSKERHSTNKR